MSLFDTIFNPDIYKKYSNVRGIQNIYTPIDKIEKATNFEFTSLINENTKEIGIIFNFEFIENLLKKCNKNYINNIHITFFYDSEFDLEEAKFIAYKYNFKIISFESIEEFSNSKNIKDLEKVMANKKFDIVFSNPPYSGIDLKILESMFSKNIADTFIWIAPIRWLQDPIAKYKRSTFNKFKKLGILQKIQNVIVIPFQKAESIFIGTRFAYDLGILVIDKLKTNNNFSLINKKISTILDKVLQKTKSIGDFCEKEKISNVRVKIPFICGGTHPGQIDDRKIFYRNEIYDNGYQNGIFWTETSKTKNQYSKKIGDPIPMSIKFNSINEATNFYNSCLDIFMHFLNYVMKNDVNVPLNFLPCMIEETNPRTGLKGYEGKWTNEDFYQFFGITKDEQKYIEETLKQFKK